MVSIKQNKLRVIAVFLLIAVAMALLPLSLVFADGQKPQPSQSALDNISQNCASIKQSLKQLQHADSRTRTYLGSAYQTVASNFITPLNLRLVRNNFPDTKLVAIQADFTATQAAFRNNYTEYMRELESLLATDCQAHPADFYNQLLATRARRAELQSSAAHLAKLVQDQITAVTALKESL